MRNLIFSLAAAALLAGPAAFAADNKDAKKDEKAKPYPLKTCLVTDEKLGEMGDPYVFAYKGQEVKLCCKSCKKDFDKDPAKFSKKLAKEAKKK